ncbi:hypothetical protein RQP46_000901 [Phenoliferia psychrophenolica]
MAAKYIFEELLASKAKSSLVTRSIIPKYANLIRKVFFDGNLTNLSKLMGMMDRLTNVHTLEMGLHAAHALFGPRLHLLDDPSGELSDEHTDDYDEDDEDEVIAERRKKNLEAGNAAVRRATFRRTTQGIRNVALSRFTMQEAGVFLRTLQGVESATFTRVDKTWEVGAELASLLSAAPRLRELSLVGSALLDINPPLDISPPAWPPLTSLTLGNLVLTSDFLRFINTFSQSLTTLRLDFLTSASSFPTQTHISSPFPFLTSVHITNASPRSTSRVLAWFAQPKGSPSPPLHNIDIEVKHATVFTPLPELNLALAPFHPTLQRVRIVVFRWPRKIPDLESHLHLPEHVERILGAPVDPFFTRSRILKAEPTTRRGDDKLVKERAQAMRETLEFGMQQVQALEEAGDLVGMETSLDSLAQLRVWQQLVGK